MSNRAWVTLATNDSYGLGALVLAHSLRRANSAYSAVILVTPSVTEAMRNRLSAVFAEVITVDVLDSRDAAHLALLQRPELGITFTKIHCWTLTQYEKCVFLDADTLVVQNCDELFEHEELSAAPDVGWPDCFNSGVFVFVPSNDTYSRLITFAKERGSFDGGDQGLLNAFFADWARGDINKHLPFLYNVTSAAFYSYLPALKHYGQDLKIIHFIGAAKPWLQHYNWESRVVDAPEHLRQYLQIWWDLFVGQVHSHLDATMETSVEVEDVPPETPPPESLPEDSHHHYAPEMDPDSEFPWHRPEAHQEETQTQATHIDMTNVHDPWQHYRGHIPARKDLPTSQCIDHGGLQNEDEIRKYAWEYQSPQTFTSRYAQEPDRQNTWHQQEQFDNEHAHYHQHEHNQHYHHQEHQHHHHEHNKSQQHDHQHWDTPHQYHHDQHQEHNYHHSNEHYYQPNDSYHQSHEHQHDHNSHHDQGHSEHNTDQTFHSDQNEQFHGHFNHSSNEQRSFHSPYDSQASQHDQQSQKSPDQFITHQKEQISDTHFVKPSKHRSNHQHGTSNYFNPYEVHPTLLQVYHVHLDHRRRIRRKIKRIHICSKQMNGDLSDTDSEDEFIIPRHPYDGFYMRHKTTIDSRGRKICTHEIPPTPSPSQSEDDLDPPPRDSSSPTPTEEFNTASECEDLDSGVAGNLARVTPGSGGFPREAIDELTRRQGWEAGNIDYMGADSFDNIWAKISQTLSAQKQPSPPKEPSLPKEQAISVAETVSTPAPEVPTPAPEASTLAPEAAAPAQEVPAPVQEATPTPEAATPTQDAAAPAPKAAVSAPAVPSPARTSVAPAQTPQTIAPVESALPTAPQAATAEAALAVEATAPEVVLKTVEEVLAEPPREKAKDKTEQTAVQPTLPATPKSTPDVSTPATESTSPETQSAAAPKALKAVELASSAAGAKAPVAEPTQPEATPEKAQDTSVATAASSDSPPLANTPSKEAPTTPAAKSEERRKPAEKLQLSPPAAGDALPTPDSELEDAAALAQSIIASELSASPALAAPTHEAPSVPVSLAQIGVKAKGKPSTAAQIESSVTDKTEASPTAADVPSSPSPAKLASSAGAKTASPALAEPVSPSLAEPASPISTQPASETPKKKVVKKVTKKESGSSGDAATPVPPPRKKEKKPKEK